MTKKKTFWNLIKNQAIEIPIIQRDYAQGRLGNEYIRYGFLSNLKQALDNTLSNDDKVLKLDFIYGSTENNSFQPLDGQQRLTTLWLMHWYIALRAGELDDNCSILKNFSYETRVSSREFCENLCTSENFKNYNNTTGITDYITKQTWFYSSWKQDPTIQSMLRMLSGTKIDDKNGNDITDGIEELFVNNTPDDFKLYWKRLTSDESPIVFYHQELKDLGLTDDLYIKMNARGKQLTNFENFKADLIGYIKEQANDNNDWKSLLDVKAGIPIKLDTTWTDIFWKKRSVNYTIDEIYFTFCKRFFWNELFTNKYQDEIEENESYKLFNDDKDVKYEGLRLYKYDDGEIPLSLFLHLEKVLDLYYKYYNIIPTCKWNKGFEFIPSYKDKNTTEGNTHSIINQIYRIIFFAICKYFVDEGEINEISLRRWMRVVWNLISGENEYGTNQIRNVEAIRSAINKLSILDSHNIYASLREQNILDKADELNLRWNEEIEKAIQIQDADGNLRKYEGTCTKEDGNTFDTWEDIILEAENQAFFNGAIRFLFHNENGEADWTQFDTKWNNAKRFFKKEIKDKEGCLNEEYNNADLLKSLISRFSTDDFDNVLWWKHCTFNNNPEVWRYYLLNDSINAPVHELMMGNTTIKTLTKSNNWKENILYYLSNTKLLDFVMKEIPYSWIRDKYHYHTAIYPSDQGVFLNAERRDEFMTRQDLCVINKKIEGSNLLYGSDIRYKWKNKNFQWYRNDTVYLMKDDNPYGFEIKDDTKDSDLEKYYCFKTNNLNDEEILLQMDKLIELYETPVIKNIE